MLFSWNKQNVPERKLTLGQWAGLVGCRPNWLGQWAGLVGCGANSLDQWAGLVGSSCRRWLADEARIRPAFWRLQPLIFFVLYVLYLLLGPQKNSPISGRFVIPYVLVLPPILIRVVVAWTNTRHGHVYMGMSKQRRGVGSETWGGERDVHMGTSKQRERGLQNTRNFRTNHPPPTPYFSTAETGFRGTIRALPYKKPPHHWTLVNIILIVGQFPNIWN